MPITSYSGATVRNTTIVPLVLALLVLASASGCGRNIPAPAIAPPSAGELQDALTAVKGKKQSVSMLKDVRLSAANTLARAGSAAPPEAVPALEKLSTATDADDDTKQAAKDAIAKIKGS